MTLSWTTIKPIFIVGDRPSFQLTSAALLNEASFPVSVKFVVQGLQADLKQFGGAGFVVAGLLQRAQNHLSFDDFDGGANRKRYRIFFPDALALIERIWREVMPLDLLAGANDHCPLDYISLLTNVPRPGVELESSQCRRAKKARRALVLLRQLRAQMLSQH